VPAQERSVPEVEVRSAVERVDRAAAYAVRHEVFVGEQGVPADIERDDLDDTADHAIGLLDGVPVAAGRLLQRADVAVIGRMAVRRTARGKGVGAALLRHLEEVAQRRGCRVVELHAQLSAREFYQRAGYVGRGDVYTEAGIEHVDMTKRLDATVREVPVRPA
jgi:predicted GNAT family N-acyltransferase